MNKQPEALRLADALDRAANYELKNHASQAAAELRRLHTANLDCVAWYEAIKAERDELLSMLKSFSDYVRDEQNATDGAVAYSTTTINHWAFLARAAIAKAGVSNEP